VLLENKDIKNLADDVITVILSNVFDVAKQDNI